MLSGRAAQIITAGAHHVRSFQDRRLRSGRDARVARIDRLGAARARRRARALPARAAHRSHAPLRRVPAVQAEHGLRQHDLHGAAAGVSRRPRPRASHQGLHPLERDGDGGAGQSAELGVRRPHRVLRVRRHALRSRLQSLLARAQRRASGRHGLHPGPFVAGHLCARLSRGAAERRPPAALPRGSGRRRPVVLSAPLADAGFLAVPDGVDGTRPDDGDLPGALHPLPRASRPRFPRATARSGRSSATARWTSPSRSARSRCRCARSSTTSCSSSTATCSASTVRCAATARSSRNSRPRSSARAGTSSR